MTDPLQPNLPADVISKQWDENEALVRKILVSGADFTGAELTGAKVLATNASLRARRLAIGRRRHWLTDKYRDGRFTNEHMDKIALI